MNHPKDDEPLKRVFAAPGEDAAASLTTVVAVEKALRQVRGFASIVTGSRLQADEFVEDALILYLSTDPDPDQPGGALAFLASTVRRMMRIRPQADTPRYELGPDLAPLARLPVDAREVAGLHLGAGLAASDIGAVLDCSAGDVLNALKLARAAMGPDVFDRLAPSV